jgi:rhodanese-related sulfurtransferase
MVRWSLLLTTLLTVFGCGAAHTDVQVDALQRFQAGAMLIDVRSPEEFQSGHIKGAVLIPHEQIRQGVETLHLAKDAEIILYCRSGNRAGIAQTALIEAGFTNVTNAGGYTAMASAQQQLRAAL